MQSQNRRVERKAADLNDTRNSSRNKHQHTSPFIQKVEEDNQLAETRPLN